MDLHNRDIALLKGELKSESKSSNFSMEQAQLDTDLRNRLDNLLRYKVEHEQPNLQPSRRYMSMDAMRRLAEEQSIKPQLESINAMIRSHPEIPKLSKLQKEPKLSEYAREIREKQKPFKAEKYRGQIPRDLQQTIESDIYRSIHHKRKPKSKDKSYAELNASGGIIEPIYFSLNPYGMSLNEADRHSSVQKLYNHDDYLEHHKGVAAGEKHIRNALERNLQADPDSLKGFNFYDNNVMQSLDSEYDWHKNKKLPYNPTGPSYTKRYVH